MELKEIDSNLKKYISALRDGAMSMYEFHMRDPNVGQDSKGSLPCYNSGYLRELDRFCKDVSYINGEIKELIGRAEQQQDHVTAKFCQ